MVGVVDLETAETKVKQNGETVQDTWLLRLPKDVWDKEGFAAGTLISLTIKDGGIQSTFIRQPSKKLREISRKLFEDDRELHRRFKEIGD